MGEAIPGQGVTSEGRSAVETEKVERGASSGQAEPTANSKEVSLAIWEGVAVMRIAPGEA